MVGSFLTDQGNYIWSRWLERETVVGVGGFAVGEHVVAVDVLKEHRDLLLGIGQAGAQAFEELDAAGVALERLLELHIARLQAADDELQLLRGLLVRKLLDRGLLCHICFLS